MFLFRSKYKDKRSRVPRKKKSRRRTATSALTLAPKPSTTALATDVYSDDSSDVFLESEILYLIAERRPYRVIEDALSGFHEDFKMRKKIGVGAYGKVMLCKRKRDGAKFAVKCIPKRRVLATIGTPEKQLLYIRALRNEVSVHSLASTHPNVASLIGVYEDNEHVFLVLEHCAGGELFDKLVADESLDEATAAAITKQLCAALKFLHEKCGAVHCDLKPANILLAAAHSLEIKVVDFGMAHVLQPGEHLSQPCGSPFYTAPEVIETGDRRPHYAQPCDMWSLGVILFTMIFNYPPFAVDTEKYKGKKRRIQRAIYRKVLRGFKAEVLSVEEFGYGPWFPDAIPASTGVRDLISRLLRPEPAARLSAAQVLKHPWIRQLADGIAVASPPMPSMTGCDLQSLDFDLAVPRLMSSTPSVCKALPATASAYFGGSVKLSASLTRVPKEVKQLITAMAKMTRGCLFREAVAKLYEGEFKERRSELYAAMQGCFEYMDSKKRGVADVRAFSGFLAQANMEPKHAAAIYRELALPGIAEEAAGHCAADGVRFDDLLTAAVIDYIGASEKRLRRVFDELDSRGTGHVAVEDVIGSLKAMHAGVDWRRVQLAICEERVGLKRASGVDYVEFLSFLHPKYQETPKWVDFLFR